MTNTYHKIKGLVTIEAGTYRAVYTVKFEDAVYVLHVFQKKSKSGISTPKEEIRLIEIRLKTAYELSKSRKKVIKDSYEK